MEAQKQASGLPRSPYLSFKGLLSNLLAFKLKTQIWSNLDFTRKNNSETNDIDCGFRGSTCDTISPLDAVETNCRPTAQIAVFRNVFSVIVPTKTKDIPPKPAKLTFGLLQKWIEDNHGVKISKSSITQVKSKCGIQKLEFGAKCEFVPELKTEKERLVLEAFRHYGLV